MMTDCKKCNIFKSCPCVTCLYLIFDSRRCTCDEFKEGTDWTPDNGCIDYKEDWVRVLRVCK